MTWTSRTIEKIPRGRNSRRCRCRGRRYLMEKGASRDIVGRVSDVILSPWSYCHLCQPLATVEEDA